MGYNKQIVAIETYKEEVKQALKTKNIDPSILVTLVHKSTLTTSVRAKLTLKIINLTTGNISNNTTRILIDAHKATLESNSMLLIQGLKKRLRICKVYHGQ